MTDPAQPRRRAVDRIDVHAHFVPDFYRQALIAAGHARPDGIAGIPSWDPETAIKVMDDLGVQTAMLSISSPGVHFGDDAQARKLSRQVNEEGARLRRTYSGRFGLLASVPLPDVQGAVAEATYALDELKADGLVLETNQNGMYLGDEALEPFWSVLDERSAVILIHPTSPACGCSPRLDAKFPRPAFEFLFDTTRSVIDLVVAGVMKRHSRLKIIVPHAGATLPVLVTRVDLGLPLLSPPGTPPPPLLRDAMRELHFDLAGAPVPQLLQALLQVADESHIHYGSDYPFTPGPLCDRLLQALEETPLLSEDVWRAVSGENARRLFPTLQAIPAEQV